MAKIIVVLALIAIASTQPTETIATSGGVSLSTQLWNWGQAAFEALLELAKCAFGNCKEQQSNQGSGEQTSVDFYSGGTKILISTGIPDDYGRVTEIIDVEQSKFNCTKIEQFPKQLYAASGALMNGQTPFICGGVVYGDYGDWRKSNDCYQLTNAGSWVKDQKATLTTARKYAGSGSLVLNDNLVLTGGSSDRYLTSIEMLSPNTTAQTLSVRLPTGFHGHCQVPWDSETFFVIGGWTIPSHRRETYFINVKTNQRTNGPSLNAGRTYHGCGELEVNGKKYIIVSGGYIQYTSLRSTEVLDKSNVVQGWLKGEDLPVSKSGFQMVSSADKKALYTVGGDSVRDYSNDIFKFHCPGDINTCRWTKSETTLRFGRDASVAFRIPNSLAEKLCK